MKNPDLTAAPPERMPSTARAVERSILGRIASGHYAVGRRLPTCEQLGRELGANKNTVSKAYQTLGRRGYVLSRPGRGTFVLKRPRQVEAVHARAEAANLIAYAVEQAAKAGIEGDQFYSLVREVVDRAARTQRIRVGFVDCNRLDAVQLGRDLEAAVGTPVEPLMLDEALADGGHMAARYDILGVSPSHLSSLEAGLRRLAEGARPEIVPILSMPDPESIVQVARLRPGTRLGVVTDMPDTLHSLVNMARAFNSSVQITATTSDNEPALLDLLAGVDVILVTATADQHIARFKPSVPAIPVSFRIDEHSAETLAGRIAELGRSRLATVG